MKGISRIINNDYYTSPKDRCFYLYINTNNTNFLFQFATSTKSEIINYLSATINNNISYKIRDFTEQNLK